MNGRIAGPLLAVACVLGLCVPPAGANPLLAQSWRELGPKERYDALQNYRRHQQLPQERQQDVEKRYQRWQGLPPEDRARVRQNYERFRQMPPQERERLERKYEKWQRQGQPPR